MLCLVRMCLESLKPDYPTFSYKGILSPVLFNASFLMLLISLCFFFFDQRNILNFLNR